jgi:hypothetical protein
MHRPSALLLAAFSASCLAWPGPAAAQTYLKASNTGPSDHFGWAVALSGDTLALGAIDEDSSATGVQGSQAGNSAADAGAVYVFHEGTGLWSQQAYVKASNTGAADKFGWAVALSGDTLVVGAQGEDSAATGVDGNQADNSADGAGAVYVFVRFAGVWTQQAYLKASNAQAGDQFGHSVSISGDTLVVSASGEDGATSGVGGDQSSNGASSAGAAYVFVRSGTGWSQQAYLKASNAQASDVFGESVSISGDTIVVGAKSEDGGSTGVNGDDTSNTKPDSGAAYVFVRSGASWAQQAYLKAGNALIGDAFGTSVSVSGDTLVVGAPLEDSNAVGVDPGPPLGSAISSGAACVFVRSAGSWSQQAYVKASNTEALDQFGSSVAISGDRIVVGAPFEASAAAGVNGDQAGNGAVNAGAAYSFVRSAGTWTQQAYLKASNTGSQDVFGLQCAVSADRVAVGAYKEDSAALGVDSDGASNASMDSGAGYVFALPASSAWTDLGSGLAGVSGIPAFTGSGALAGGSLNTLALTNAAPSSPAGLFIALSSTPTPFKGGTLLPVPALSVLVLATSPAGSVTLPFVMSAGLPAGTGLWLQWAIQDPAAVQGTALSNGLEGVTP